MNGRSKVVLKTLEKLVSQYEGCLNKFAPVSPTLMEKFSADGVRIKLKKHTFQKLNALGSNLIKKTKFPRAIFRSNQVHCQNGE